jgi:hypothetical protein
MNQSGLPNLAHGLEPTTRLRGPLMDTTSLLTVVNYCPEKSSPIQVIMELREVMIARNGTSRCVWMDSRQEMNSWI